MEIKRGGIIDENSKILIYKDSINDKILYVAQGDISIIIEDNKKE